MFSSSKDIPVTSLAKIAQLDICDAVTIATPIPEEDRTDLLLTLALAMLYLSEESCPRLIWSSDNIFFGNDDRSNMSRPYLSSLLLPPQSSPSPSSELPYSLSFAQLLWEIETGSRVPEAAGLKDQSGTPSTLSQTMSTLKGKRELRQELKQIIGACIAMTNLDQDHDTRCDFIYHKIVLPLEQMARPPQVSRPVDGRQQAATQYLKPDTIVLYDECEISLPDANGPADTFTKNLKEFTSVHILGNGQNNGIPIIPDRIKVAIIDSGITDRGVWRQNAETDGRFAEGRSWAGPDPDNFLDTYGHGTHVAYQIIFGAPKATIYVAKIADGKEISKDGASAIAKAINYAVDVWKVDIISLSFGLRRENECIARAISNATQKNPVTGKSTLVFAAAGNDGIHEYRAWPARRQDVIGIHAADGRGNLISNFSPPPMDDRDNFAALGIGTKSTWKGCNVRKSGTSFAVPMAVAIAANMLEFTKQHMPEDEKLLYSAAKMKSLLRSLSMRKGEYNFLMPWKICNIPPCDQQGCPERHCTHCVRRLRLALESAILGR
ncbi:hypothetical protein TWF730_002057 [Orbilia blumenaviensis]|uniref:Peptidase S8/S53 domain-containing protein n=1 Tax=Orbilia blumenaviensis TaxID=1796055 RepID=A0AAV9UFZ9_9PEZI